MKEELTKASADATAKAEAGEQRLDIVELGKFARLYKKGLNYFLK